MNPPLPTLPASAASAPAELRRCIDDACRRASAEVTVFFRADDVGVPGRCFTQMMALFARCRVPLSLAVVPAWVTPERWRAISTAAPIPPELLCWHQHGWRHVNHEPRGKKQEFGPARAYAAVQRDIQRGKARLETILGRHFYPVFTPPWNRCSPDTLRVIRDLGYRAVSRSHPAPPPPAGLTDFAVNLDLHTRKDGGGSLGWTSLLQDVQDSLSGGRCGIMLHHQRMNAAALDMLAVLLELLVAHPRIRLLNFKDLPANPGTE